jgi:hypothetical protein
MVSELYGKPPDSSALSRVASLLITPKGRIYAVDERTGAVHVFDANGAPQMVCAPDPGDYDGNVISPSLTVSDAGDIFVTRRDITSELPQDFLRYDSSCARIGVASLALEDVSQEWLSQPGSRRRWVLGYTRAYLVDPDDSIVRRLERTAENQWLESPDTAATAPDGAIAIVSGRHGEMRFITLYSGSGDAIVTWPAPEHLSTRGGAIAFDGEYLAVVIHSDDDKRSVKVLITDARGKALFEVPLEAAGYNATVAFVTAGGRQLWTFDGKSRIDRYVVPTQHK